MLHPFNADWKNIDVVASLSVIGTSEKEEMRMEKEKERKGNKEIDRYIDRERERERNTYCKTPHEGDEGSYRPNKW